MTIADGKVHNLYEYVTKHWVPPILNVGSGMWDFKYEGERVKNVDLEQHHDLVDYVEDFSKTSIGDNKFNTVLMLNVIEHYIEPMLLLKQAYRVLCDGGKLIISAPFVIPVHKMPVDYWRFTKDGLLLLCSNAGFKYVEIEKYTPTSASVHHRGVFKK